ncbi:MAG: hypothetical protein IJ660_04910 [Alphaproteobacteria bacterium]|nr:hypothetical protein [Alphaproteobacteria bacterium]
MTDHEFTEKALFDNEFVTHTRQNADMMSKYYDDQYQWISDKLQFNKKSAKDFKKESYCIKEAYDLITSFTESDSKQGFKDEDRCVAAIIAERYLDSLVADKQPTYKKPPQLKLTERGGTIWRNLKNKIKNRFFPDKKIKKLQAAMNNIVAYKDKDPFVFYDRESSGKYARSFEEVVDNREYYCQYFNRTIQSLSESQERSKLDKENNSTLKTMDAINAERDKAAKKIELQAQARENLGITNNEQGIDALAARADAMKNMTPKQRLAFRLSQLRGTAKKQPQAKVVPMKQQQKDQTMIIKKMNEGRA